jgi:FtsH-binding integral membrane protein
MKNEQHAGPSIMSSIIILLTMLQVGVSGVVVYFVINEMSYGRGPAGLMLLLILVVIAVVDLFLVSSVVRLIESWVEH